MQIWIHITASIGDFVESCIPGCLPGFRSSSPALPPSLFPISGTDAGHQTRRQKLIQFLIVENILQKMTEELIDKLAGRIRPFGGLCGSPFWPSFLGHVFVSNFCASDNLDTVSAPFESRCPKSRCHLSHVVVEDGVIFVEGRFSYIPAHAHVGHSLTFP